MVEINNKTKTKINQKLIEDITKKFLKKYKQEKKDVSIAFIGDIRMKKLNSLYRGIDKTTDVLSFCDSSNDFLGEVIISYSQIKKQAKQQKKTIEQELIFILVHGLLHLVGYDDDTERKRKKMICLGEDFIKKYG